MPNLAEFHDTAPLNTTKCILDYWGGMLNTEEIKDN